MPTLTTNKKVRYDYQILDTLEAGVVLSGPEVKSTKHGQINLKGSYISVDASNQAWLVGCHIAPYKPASSVQKNYQPTHTRKLLLQKKQIATLIGKLHMPGLTILPLSVYTKGSFIKIEIGIVKGKKKHDKRETIKKREVDREIRIRMKRR